MLKRLFTSNVRIKLLRTFLLKPDEEHYIRELTRKLDEQINSVRRELDNLKKTGVLKTKSKFRKKYYYTNKSFLFYEELRSIFQKSESSISDIANTISEFGEVKILVFSGIFIEKDTPVDLFVVGKINREKLTDYLNNDLSTKKPVRFTIMTEEDFKYRVECKDKFVLDIMKDKDSVIPIKKLDIE